MTPLPPPLRFPWQLSYWRERSSLARWEVTLYQVLTGALTGYVVGRCGF